MNNNSKIRIALISKDKMIVESFSEHFSNHSKVVLQHIFNDISELNSDFEYSIPNIIFITLSKKRLVTTLDAILWVNKLPPSRIIVISKNIDFSLAYFYVQKGILAFMERSNNMNKYAEYLFSHFGLEEYNS